MPEPSLADKVRELGAEISAMSNDLRLCHDPLQELYVRVLLPVGGFYRGSSVTPIIAVRVC